MAMVHSPTELEDPSLVGGCDRRLSRAARRLLETSLRSMLGNGGTSSTDDDVWILLEQWLRHAQPSECPLFPSRDCLRYEEEQSIPMHPFPEHWSYAIPYTTSKERRQLASSSREGKKQYHHQQQSHRWYKCGICHKVFMSRYYMDLHWNTHHHNLDGDCGSGNNNLICPAKDWCRMMGMANCYQQALLDEPYYDRGSSTGMEDHGKMMQHKYSKMAQSIPCHVEEIQRECRTMLEACRITDPTTISNWCESWTCPSPHSLSFLWSTTTTSASSLPSLVPEDWRRIWMSEETNGYSYSGLMIGLLVLVAIYAWLYFIVMMGPSALPTSRSNKGLIVSNNSNNSNNKRKQAASSSSDTRPMTLYDPVPASWLRPSKKPPPSARSPAPFWHKKE